MLKLLRKNNYSITSYELGSALSKQNVTLPFKSLSASVALLEQVIIEQTEEPSLFRITGKEEFVML